MGRERVRSDRQAPIQLEQTSSEDSSPVKGHLQSTSGLSQVAVDSGSSSAETSPVHAVHYHCGVGPCRPKGLQRCASAKFFTFMLCVNGLIEGALVSGFTSVVISSIEKRYQFSSLAASMIIAIFDLSVTLSVIFISYFGHKSHKPRWLGIALIIQGIGAFVFSLPQFIFGRYEVGSNTNLRYESCDNSGSSTSSCSSANDIAYSFFIIGNVLIGIGAAPLFTLGTSFIDDIVHPKYVSLHLGLFYMTAVVGPAIGYGLGGAFLSVFVDPWHNTHLGESDPGWVGAWWMCFILSGIVSVLFSIPFLMYPRRLRNTHLVQEARKLEMASSYKSKYEHEDSFLVQLKAFPTHMAELFRNTSYVFLTAGIAVLFFSLDGMVSFGPKYIESVYGVPASRASILVGAIAIPGGGLGVIAGALLVYLTKSKGKRLSIIPWVLAFAALPATIGFLFNCPGNKIAGIHTDVGNSSISLGGSDVLLSSCNYDCHCNSTLFEPVCGADGLTYFSPCRAGCQKYYNDDNSNDPVFVNCSCVAEQFYQDSIGDTTNPLITSGPMDYIGNSSAVNGMCDTNCHNLGVFLFFVGILIFLLFVLKIPTVLVTMRAVADEQRSLALGVQSVFFRLFGAIPGPIAFGAAIDSGCIYWQYECNRRGNCWVYDNNVLGIRAFAIAISGLTLTAALFVLTWIFYPPINCKSNGNAEKDIEKEKTSSDSDAEVDVFIENNADTNGEVINYSL